MSTTTPNLTLTLYDSTTDQVVTFATFRAVWGGTATTSNFYRIDTWAGTVNSSITTLQNQKGAITVPASYVSANYYEATVASITSYITGMTILLKLDTDSAGTVTLNINALGTKSVTKVNSSGSVVNITGGELQSNRYYMFTYDGTQWVWVNANSADQVYHGGTSGNVVLVASDGSISDSSTPATVVGSAVYNATAKTTLANADTIGITDSAASNVLKKITWSNFQTAIGTALGTIINALTGKTTPVGADVIAIGDSASSFASKLVLLSNLYKSLGTGTQDSTTFLRGDGTYATPSSGGTQLSSSSPLVYTSSTTWTKPSGLVYVVVEVIGGGGAGGGAATTSGSDYSCGGGGGGGGYSKKKILAASLGSTETVTVGNGGTGVSGAAGNQGASSSFGSHASGGGGGGGSASAASAVLAFITAGGGGAGSGGNINSSGDTGGPGVRNSLPFAGSGGGTFMGGGGAGGVTAGAFNGVAGNAYGGGGSGAANAASQSARAGGAGASGVVVVWEYVQ